MPRSEDTKRYLDTFAIRWLLAGLAGVTLYFQINVADPFNSPKMWVVLLIASWLIGYVIRYRSVLYTSKDLVKSFYFIAIFMISMGFASLVTDVRYIALFGDTQRRNGLLTYLGFSIIFISALMFFRTYNIQSLFTVTLFIASVSAFYGGLQTTGNDFVDWKNSHNPLIGTQGNPNFSSAVMAVMAVILCSSVLLRSTSNLNKTICILVSLTLIFLIFRSNARQGLLSFLIGVGVLQLIWIAGKNRKFGLIYTLVSLPILVLGILGILQIGPLQNLLYKSSVTVRGYYWRAGWEMLKDNPLFGVGIDRYGAYFMEYRDVAYPLNYGFEITSSNAHNTFLQFFATGGIFLGASYLLLTVWVFTRAIKGLRKLEGDSRLALAGLFSAWIAFHAQSFVSIDNLGVSIWGWVLSGSIIGVSTFESQNSNEARKVFSSRRNDFNLQRVLISGLITFLTIALVAVLYRGENNTYKSAGSYNQQDQAAIAIFRSVQLRVANTPLVDINYHLRSAQSLIQFGLVDEGLKVLDNVYQRDQRNLDTLKFLSLTYEYKNEFDKSIEYREKIVELNPWDAPNYLQLGLNYKKVGDTVKSSEMLNILNSFSSGPNSAPILEQAREQLP